MPVEPRGWEGTQGRGLFLIRKGNRKQNEIKHTGLGGGKKLRCTREVILEQTTVTPPRRAVAFSPLLTSRRLRSELHTN